MKLFNLLALAQVFAFGVVSSQLQRECRPRICPTVYSPLCASNGKTYGNSCEFKSATCLDPTITVVHKGECERCTKRCGPYQECYFYEGQSYCRDTCAEGACEKEEICKLEEVICVRAPCPPIKKCIKTPEPTKTTCSPRICPKIYQPVCASNGKTYGNKCEFKGALCLDPSLTILYEGECKPEPTKTTCGPVICPEIYQPVCASNGKTYSNKCEFKGALCLDPSLTILYEGECKPEPTKTTCGPVICPAIYQPVCGSDGKTYGNKCEFSAAACRDSTLKLAHDGPCEFTTPPICPKRPCSDVKEPVCDSNGMTHLNKCLFEDYQCNNPGVTIAYEGECKTPEPTKTTCGPIACQAVYQPVCASNGKTYSNECYFKAALCLDPTMTILYKGECKTTKPPPCLKRACPDVKEPVCDSNGMNHQNKCFFEDYQCSNPDVIIAYEGECKKPNCDMKCGPYQECAIYKDESYCRDTCAEGTCAKNELCRLNQVQCVRAPCPPIALCISIFEPTETPVPTKPNCEPKICPDTYPPVCASNGKTYGNKCEFSTAACLDSSLTYLHDGKCESVEI